MASNRDKEYHFLRNSEKYLGNYSNRRGEQSKEDAEKEAKYDKIHGKYGFKSMVVIKEEETILVKVIKEINLTKEQKIEQKIKELNKKKFKSI